MIDVAYFESRVVHHLCASAVALCHAQGLTGAWCRAGFGLELANCWFYVFRGKTVLKYGMSNGDVRSRTWEHRTRLDELLTPPAPKNRPTTDDLFAAPPQHVRGDLPALCESLAASCAAALFSLREDQLLHDVVALHAEANRSQRFRPIGRQPKAARVNARLLLVEADSQPETDMEKYGVDHQLVRLLLQHKLCSSENEALEKVASAEATSLLAGAGVTLPDTAEPPGWANGRVQRIELDDQE